MDVTTDFFMRFPLFSLMLQRMAAFRKMLHRGSLDYNGQNAMTPKTTRVEPDVTVVDLSGRLNLGNTLMSIETYIKRLIDEGSQKVVVHVSELTYIDSAGIGMLVSCFGHAEKSAGELRIAGARDAVAKVFEVVHLDRIVPLDTDLAAACLSFSRADKASGAG
jgi:anti-sigma B factor antagonist